MRSANFAVCALWCSGVFNASLLSAFAPPINTIRSHPDAATAVFDTTKQEMEHDIEELKRQAAERLESLLEQMDDLQAFNKEAESPSVISQKVVAGAQHLEGPAIAKQKNAPSRKVIAISEAEPLSIKKKSNDGRKSLSWKPEPAPRNLLDDTVWKIVFNIGREKGTWMPSSWGASGDRLLFQVTVKFTCDKATEGDEFFQGNDNLMKLAVTDAFVIPRGVGSHSVGRRPLPVKATGSYKVCRGQGPTDTDIVRLFVELEGKVKLTDHESDVVVPAGRVYGTCGYFSIPTKHPADAGPSHRDIVQEEYAETIRTYEHLQLAVDRHEHGLFSLEHLQMMKDAWEAKAAMEEKAKELQIARQREPEKSQLRLNKAGTCGLSREGGVCCRVHKGVALEYHILGRMEVACIEDQHHKESPPLSPKLTP